ncbi:hypothetical protein HaLaN_06520 [Haematococcus lacustris]|uniref:Uncharacterized protein n=1 Tax=Haematococcus lacustris TaxID=44745 RepID=A0A699YW71_HAELA|nr:hypothetical protein HaLaN_06520 [Haematococcus lacustris]
MYRHASSSLAGTSPLKHIRKDDQLHSASAGAVRGIVSKQYRAKAKAKARAGAMSGPEQLVVLVAQRGCLWRGVVDGWVRAEGGQHHCCRGHTLRSDTDKRERLGAAGQRAPRQDDVGGGLVALLAFAGGGLVALRGGDDCSRLRCGPAFSGTSPQAEDVAAGPTAKTPLQACSAVMRLRSAISRPQASYTQMLHAPSSNAEEAGTLTASTRTSKLRVARKPRRKAILRIRERRLLARLRKPSCVNAVFVASDRFLLMAAGHTRRVTVAGDRRRSAKSPQACFRMVGCGGASCYAFAH